MHVKRKGYRVERNIRLMFQKYGWTVIRSGASLGESDLICLKEGKCIILQIKSTKKKTLYYYGYSAKNFEGFPFYLIVDFGYGKIKILEPKKKVSIVDGQSLHDFLQTFN